MSRDKVFRANTNCAFSINVPESFLLFALSPRHSKSHENYLVFVQPKTSYAKNHRHRNERTRKSWEEKKSQLAWWGRHLAKARQRMSTYYYCRDNVKALGK